MKKALIVVTSQNQIEATGQRTGWYLPEVTHVFYPLRESGFEIEFASPKGGAAPMDPKSMKLEDPINRRFVEAGLLKELEHTLAENEVDSSRYEVIFFAGGHGTMWDFPGAKQLQAAAARIYENGGIVAAVCHGPAALVGMKFASGKFLVDGKEVSVFTNEEEAKAGMEKIVPFLLEDELARQGAILRASPAWANRVVVSERLVTGQNPQSALSLGEAVARLAREKSGKPAPAVPGIAGGTVRDLA